MGYLDCSFKSGLCTAVARMNNRLATRNLLPCSRHMITLNEGKI
jgi:hypothetical protein